MQTTIPTVPALVVLVTDSSAAAERLSGMLTAVRCRVLAVANWQTAEARILGGGVSLVVLSVSPGPETERIWSAVAALHQRDAGLPIITVRDSASNGSGGPPAAPVPEGVQIVNEAEMMATAHALIERRRNPQQKSGREDPTCIVSLQGAKGGVGTTTVALNLAAVLASRGKTILAEVRQGPGTLAAQLGLRRPVRTVADLARSAEAPRTADIAADIQDALWPCPQIPGLSVLFGPQSFDSSADWSERVGPILSLAAGLADYVVVDLPHCFSSLHRAALRVTDRLLLVLERDALCLHAGKLMLRTIEAENLLPQAAGVVVVNRVPLSVPAELPEIEHELNIPVQTSVPAAAELCLRAYREQKSVVTLDPESAVAVSMTRLAECLPVVFRERRPVHV